MAGINLEWCTSIGGMPSKLRALQRTCAEKKEKSAEAKVRQLEDKFKLKRKMRK